MPIFLDSHRGNDLPLDTIRDFLRAARSGSMGHFGVRPLDLYCGDDGRVFYVFAAPDEAAVRQSHAAEGVVCPRVRRVQALHAKDELADEVKAVVRKMIVAEQASASLGSRGADDDKWLRQVG
jgi:hypothetical protein